MIYEVDIIMGSFQNRKLRIREIKGLAKNHTVSGKSQYFLLDRIELRWKPMFLIMMDFFLAQDEQDNVGCIWVSTLKFTYLFAGDLKKYNPWFHHGYF